MERIGLFIFVWLFNPGILLASKKDSIVTIHNPKSTFLKQQILSVSVIAMGTLPDNGDIKYTIQEKFLNTNTSIDDILEYNPMTQIYLFDSLNFKV